MDRRTRKSRSAMEDALISMMRKMPVEEITVTDLCQLADVNRSTFYAHYESVEQMLSIMYEELLRNMDEVLGYEAPDRESSAQPLASVLGYLCQDGSRFRLYLSNNASNLFERVLIKYYWERYCGPQASRSRRYAFVYHAYGSLNMIRQWIADGCPGTELELAEQIIHLTADETK